MEHRMKDFGELSVVRGAVVTAGRVREGLIPSGIFWSHFLNLKISFQKISSHYLYKIKK